MNFDPQHTNADRVAHDHHDEIVEGGAAASSMMLMILAVVAAFVLLGVVMAWSPWGDNDNVTPGQGGDDNLPRQEERIPPRDGDGPSDQPQRIPSDPQRSPR